MEYVEDAMENDRPEVFFRYAMTKEGNIEITATVTCGVKFGVLFEDYANKDAKKDIEKYLINKLRDMMFNGYHHSPDEFNVIRDDHIEMWNGVRKKL